MGEQEATTAANSSVATANLSVAREYIVLEQLASSSDWGELGRVTATSAAGAIRTASDDTSGAYVAVPLRSWKPQRVTVATRPTVQMEELT